MSNESIKRTLFSNQRISIDFFMYMPTMLKQKSGFINSVNPILMIRWLNKKSPVSTYGSNTFYKVTPKNLYRTILFFDKIISWFSDPSMKDLFLINESGDLVFNADYLKVKAVVGNPQYDQCVMKAIPTVVEFNAKKYEGIYLYINKVEQSVPLIVNEIEVIYDLLKTFSFQEEIVLNLMSYQYASTNNTIESDSLRWKSNGHSGGDSSRTPFD